MTEMRTFGGVRVPPSETTGSFLVTPKWPGSLSWCRQGKFDQLTFQLLLLKNSQPTTWLRALRFQHT